MREQGTAGEESKRKGEYRRGRDGFTKRAVKDEGQGGRCRACNTEVGQGEWCMCMLDVSFNSLRS